MHDPYFCMIVDIKNNQNCKLSQRNFRPQLNSALKIRRQLIFSQNLVTDQPTKKWRLFDVNLTGCAHWGPHVHIFVKMSSNWRYIVASINGQNKVENVRLFFGYFWPWKANLWRWKSVEKSSNWPSILTSKNSWKVVKLTLNTDVKKQLKNRQIDLEYWRQKTVEKGWNFDWFFLWKECFHVDSISILSLPLVCCSLTLSTVPRRPFK